MSGQKGGCIRAWIPQRFCSVDTSTQGGAIKIEGLTEANLCAYSYGGSIDVGNVKAIEAIADTGGGDLKGVVLAQGTCDTSFALFPPKFTEE